MDSTVYAAKQWGYFKKLEGFQTLQLLPRHFSDSPESRLETGPRQSWTDKLQQTDQGQRCGEDISDGSGPEGRGPRNPLPSASRVALLDR